MSVPLSPTARLTSKIITFNGLKKSRGSGHKITDIIKEGQPSISLELCPKRGPLNWDILGRMSPRFCAVSWLEKEIGNIRTNPALNFFKELKSLGHEVLLHLAGRNLNKAEALLVLDHFKREGGMNVFALQGDPSRILEADDKKCDFPYAVDLVRFIRAEFGTYFCIAVAGYPEKHPKSKSTHEDMIYLQRKVSCGADLILTQASFSTDAHLEFARNCRKYSINVPIVVGLFVITSYKSLMNLSRFCSVPVPDSVLSKIIANQENGESVEDFGISLAADMITRLLGAPDLIQGVHIFTLNNLEVVERIQHRLGLDESSS